MSNYYESLARKRGWNQARYEQAVALGDEDAITLLHPTNFLTEGEADAWEAGRIA